MLDRAPGIPLLQMRARGEHAGFEISRIEPERMVEGPKIALAVLVENGGFGARAAAPIARTVLDYFLLGKLPREPRRAAPETEVKSDAASD
jgi:cell division protein FtsI/penicillin-binding protein 2